MDNEPLEKLRSAGAVISLLLVMTCASSGPSKRATFFLVNLTNKMFDTKNKKDKKSKRATDIHSSFCGNIDAGWTELRCFLEKGEDQLTGTLFARAQVHYHLVILLRLHRCRLDRAELSLRKGDSPTFKGVLWSPFDWNFIRSEVRYPHLVITSSEYIYAD